MRRQHKTVRVRYGSMDAPIDIMIAPLIKELWKRDILTMNSCQENKPGIIWIQFISPGDAIHFLDLAGQIPSKKDLKTYKFWDTMYGRMTHAGGFAQWEYDCWVQNVGEKNHCIDFRMAISIRFPQTDLPEIMERINASPIPIKRV